MNYDFNFNNKKDQYNNTSDRYRRYTNQTLYTYIYWTHGFLLFLFNFMIYVVMRRFFIHTIYFKIYLVLYIINR